MRKCLVNKILLGLMLLSACSPIHTHSEIEQVLQDSLSDLFLFYDIDVKEVSRENGEYYAYIYYVLAAQTDLVEPVMVNVPSIGNELYDSLNIKEPWVINERPVVRIIYSAGESFPVAHKVIFEPEGELRIKEGLDIQGLVPVYVYEDPLIYQSDEFYEISGESRPQKKVPKCIPTINNLCGNLRKEQVKK